MFQCSEYSQEIQKTCIPGEKERFLFSARSILSQAYYSGFSQAHFRNGRGLDDIENHRQATTIRDEMLQKLDLAWGIEFLELAYDIAEEFHAGKFRRSGDPEFSHPLSVAKILLEDFPNPTTFKAIVGLLHDVIEDAKDPEAMKAQILERFRKKTFEKEQEFISKFWFLEAMRRLDFMLQFSSEIVEAVDMLSKKKKESLRNGHVIMKDWTDREYFDRMWSLLENRQFLATLEVKLADKLQNCQTSSTETVERMENIIRETVEEYFPLALSVNRWIFDLLSEEVENLKIELAKKRAVVWIETTLESG